MIILMRIIIADTSTGLVGGRGVPNRLFVGRRAVQRLGGVSFLAEGIPCRPSQRSSAGAGSRGLIRGRRSVLAGALLATTADEVFEEGGCENGHEN